ncbi:DUF6098 family protein [Actinomadura gamaensis]|uniref:DUF6098 family protein n=1 Tax=Actinomadura gamaensis TaxID=1763541 RepID=A0ABV9UDG5_9ACTN
MKTLADLAELVENESGLFVRWSRGPEVDEGGVSKDDLTGTELPGLSANALDVEDWWKPRPVWMWVARRLYDYSHLAHEKGPGVRPWVLEGEVVGHGPDNEPLVACRRPIAWIEEDVLEEAERAVAEQRGDWGPLRRTGDA